jgi:phage gp36-like protein
MYSTRDDIKKLLPEETIIQLTDDENLKPASIDPENPAHAKIIERIDEAIETADGEIDGYCLSAGCAVPLTTVSRLITGLSVEIAIYYLYARRTVPEKVEKRYDKAISKLKDISSGRLTLGVDPPPAPSTTGGAASNKPVSDRIFTRGTLRGF